MAGRQVAPQAAQRHSPSLRCSRHRQCRVRVELRRSHHRTAKTAMPSRRIRIGKRATVEWSQEEQT